MYNAPYSSAYHCIELIFSKIKRLYRKNMVREDFVMTDAQHKAIIQDCVGRITKDHV
jgi:hypothetical protein